MRKYKWDSNKKCIIEIDTGKPFSPLSRPPGDRSHSNRRLSRRHVRRGVT